MIKKIIALILLVVALPLSHCLAQEKLRRAESFFGFHFDFHAVAADKNLGENFDLALLDTFLLRTKPDYIQIDSKGHFGFSSYPTKVGYSANSFVKDPVRLWKNMADKHNLPLFVHYSGLWDDEAIRQNPEWGRLNADGTRDATKVGYTSGYTKKLLIPQLKELIDTYGIDGAWIDGDCWAALPDYAPDLTAGFKRDTGIDPPSDPKSPHYERWKEYNRDAFRRYVKTYVDEIHRYRPKFQITSNWAYSSFMPEAIDVEVDFLSGDVAGTNCVYSAAFEARCLALQGKSWDLMAWGMIPVNFWGGTHTPKPVIQLKQEAAEVMAMGGGFQVYFRQNRDGAFQTLDTDALTGLAQFCRERQPFCQNSSIIPNIGIWYSLAGWKEETKEGKNVYGTGGSNPAIKSIFNLFIDSRQSVEILMDHHIRDRMDQYALIVIPEWVAFDPAIKTQLSGYVRNGGNLLVIGAKTTREFKDWLGVSFSENPGPGELMIGGRDLGGITGLKALWQPVTLKEETETVGAIYTQTDYRYPADAPIGTVNAYGKGKIGAVYTNISEAYSKYKNPVLNAFLNAMVSKLVPDSPLKVSGSDEVHTVLASKNGNRLVHLINASGQHANPNVFGYNELRPTPALTVNLKTEKKPKEVRLQPEGKKLEFTFRGGRTEIIVPPVEVHSIVEVVTD